MAPNMSDDCFICLPMLNKVLKDTQGEIHQPAEAPTSNSERMLRNQRSKCYPRSSEDKQWTPNISDDCFTCLPTLNKVLKDVRNPHGELHQPAEAPSSNSEGRLRNQRSRRYHNSVRESNEPGITPLTSTVPKRGLDQVSKSSYDKKMQNHQDLASEMRKAANLAQNQLRKTTEKQKKEARDNSTYFNCSRERPRTSF